MNEWVKEWTEDIDLEGVCYLVYATVDIMYSDYISCDNEIERIKSGHNALKNRWMHTSELSLFKNIGLRTIERITGEKHDRVGNYKRLINQNLDIYVEELENEKLEILDFFQGHIFTAILPYVEPEEAKRMFLENVKKIKAKQERIPHAKSSNPHSATSHMSYGRPRKFLRRSTADERQNMGVYTQGR